MAIDFATKLKTEVEKYRQKRKESLAALESERLASSERPVGQSSAMELTDFGKQWRANAIAVKESNDAYREQAEREAIARAKALKEAAEESGDSSFDAYRRGTPSTPQTTTPTTQNIVNPNSNLVDIAQEKSRDAQSAFEGAKAGGRVAQPTQAGVGNFWQYPSMTVSEKPTADTSGIIPPSNVPYDPTGRLVETIVSPRSGFGAEMAGLEAPGTPEWELGLKEQGVSTGLKQSLWDKINEFRQGPVTTVGQYLPPFGLLKAYEFIDKAYGGKAMAYSETIRRTEDLMAKAREGVETKTPSEVAALAKSLPKGELTEGWEDYSKYQEEHPWESAAFSATNPIWWLTGAGAMEMLGASTKTIAAVANIERLVTGGPIIERVIGGLTKVSKGTWKVLEKLHVAKQVKNTSTNMSVLMADESGNIVRQVTVDKASGRVREVLIDPNTGKALKGYDVDNTGKIIKELTANDLTFEGVDLATLGAEEGMARSAAFKAAAREVPEPTGLRGFEEPRVTPKPETPTPKAGIPAPKVVKPTATAAKATAKEPLQTVGKSAEVPTITAEELQVKAKTLGFKVELVDGLDGEQFVVLTYPKNSFNGERQALLENVKGAPEFLPFKSIDDANKFLDTGDAALVTRTLTTKAPPMSAESLAAARAGTEIIAKKPQVPATINTFAKKPARVKPIDEAKVAAQYHRINEIAPAAKIQRAIDDEYNKIVNPVRQKIDEARNARPYSRQKMTSDEYRELEVATDKFDKKVANLRKQLDEFPLDIQTAAKDHPEYADIELFVNGERAFATIPTIGKAAAVGLSAVPGAIDQANKEEGISLGWLVVPAAVAAVVLSGGRRPVRPNGVLRGLPTLRSFQEVVDVTTKPDNMRAIANQLSKSKAGRETLKVIGGDSAVSTGLGSAAWENPIRQAAVARAVQLQAGDSLSAAVMAPLNARKPFVKVFGEIGDDGLIKSGRLAGQAADDIVEHPERFANLLDNNQREWIQAGQQIADDKLAFLRSNGIDIKELSFDQGGHYWGRRVYAKVDPNGDIVESAVVTGGRPGSRTASEKTRIFANAADAVSEGFRYLPPDEAMALNVKSAYRRVADKQYADWLIKELPFGTNGVADATKLAAWMEHTRIQKLNNLDNFIGTMSRSSDLNDFPMLTRMGDTFPTLKVDLEALKSASGTQRQTLLRNLKPKIRNQMANTRRDFEAAKAILKRERETARRVGYTEGSLADIPAFAGKKLTGPKGKEMAALIRSQITPEFSAALTAVNKVNAIGRFMALAGDMSPATIQLQFLAFQNPRAYGKAMGGFWKAFFDPEYLPKMYQAHGETIAKHPGMMLAGGTRTEFTEAMRQGGLLASKPAQKTVGKVLGPFQRGFEASIDTAGIYMAESMEGLANNAAMLADLDSFINKARGLLNSRGIGIANQQRQIESALFLAAQYNRATFALLSDVARGGIRGSLAREYIAKGVTGVAAAVTAISIARGESPEQIINHLTPIKLDVDGKPVYNPDFMTFNVAGQRIGPGGKVRSVVVLAARMLTDPLKAPEHAANFIRGNFSPLVSTATDLISGENYIGDKSRDGWLSLSRTVLGENLLPIWLQSTAMGSGDPIARMTRGFSEFLGGRASEMTAAQRRNEIRAQKADELGVDDWYVISWTERQKITESDPELKKWTETASQNWKESDLPEAVLSNDVTNRLDAAKERHAKEINQAALNSQHDGDWETFKDAVKTWGEVLGSDYDQIYSNPEYQPVIDQWAELARKNKAQLKQDGLTEAVEDIAYEEYLSVVNNPALEKVYPDGAKEFDYRAYDEALQAFKNKWGDEIWSAIKERKNYDERGYPKEYFEYQEAKEKLKPYWAIEDAVYAALESGNNPNNRRYEDARQVIADYQKWSMTATADDMAKARAGHKEIDLYNKMMKATRENWRKTHTEGEAMLNKFYGYKYIGLQGR